MTQQTVAGHSAKLRVDQHRRFNPSCLGKRPVRFDRLFPCSQLLEARKQALFIILGEASLQFSGVDKIAILMAAEVNTVEFAAGLLSPACDHECITVATRRLEP